MGGFRHLTSGFLWIILFSALANPAGAQESKEQKEFRYASKLFDDELYDIAVSQLNRFIIDYPGSPNRVEALRLLGHSYFNLGSHSDSRRVFMKLQEEYHDSPQGEEALYMIGRSAEELGEREYAAEAYKRFTAYYPRSEHTPVAYLASGVNYLEGGNRVRAKAMLKELKRKFGRSAESVDASVKLARIYEDDGNLDGALKELVEAEVHGLSRDRMPAILHARSRIYIGMSDFDGAEKSLEALLKYSDKDVDVLYGALLYGDLLLSNGDPKEAAEKYEFVLKHTDGELNIRAGVKLGDALVLQGKPGEALKEYGIVPRDGLKTGEVNLLRFREAYASELSGDNSAALIRYGSIFDDGWTDSLGIGEEAVDRMSLIAMRANDPRGAAAFCQMFLDSEPESPGRDVFAFRAGQIYQHELGDYEKAITYYSVVTDTSLRSVLADDARYETGRCLFELGRIRESIEVLRDVAVGYPGSGFVSEAERLADYEEEFLDRRSDLGVERLAEMIGDLITEKPRDQLYLDLAQVYYEEMKDFKRAVEHLGNLLNINPSPEIESEALYLLGMANIRLSENAEFVGEEDLADYYRQEAKIPYMRLIQKYPTGERSAQAAFYLVEMTRGEPSERRSAFTAYLEAQPETPFEDRVLMAVAETFYSEGNRDEARIWYTRLLKETPRSPLSEEASLKLALISQFNGSPDRARLELQGYIQRYPQGRGIVHAKYLLANSLYEAGKQEQAMNAFLDLVENHYYSEYVDSVRAVLGRVYHEGGDYQRALDFFLTAGKEETWFEKTFVPWRVPGKGEDLYYAASSADRLGKTQMAATFYRRYLQPKKVNVNSFEAAKSLYAIYDSSNRVEESKSLLISLLRKKWTPEEALHLRGLLAGIYFSEEDYPLARSEYQKAVKSAPKNADLKPFEARIVVCYFREGKIKDADRQEEQFNKKYGRAATQEQRAELLHERGIYLSIMGNNEEARKLFTDVVKAYPATRFAPEANLRIGLMDVEGGKPGDALERFEDILERYPENRVIARVFIAVGDVHHAAKHYQEAIAAYKRALDHAAAKKSESEAMRKLLRSYEEVGLYDSAIALAGEYVRRHPEADDAFSMRIKTGNYLMNIADYEAALRHFEDLLPYADSETSAEIQFWIGECYFNSELYSRAITEYLKVPYLTAPTRLDWSASAWWKAGNAYEQMGSFGKAVMMYRRIIQEKGAASDYGRYAQQRIDDLRLTGKLPKE